jgi:hypothetical protein
MDDQPAQPEIGDHIRAIAARGDEDAELLSAVISQQCWPGGGADSTSASARQWVRRWRPVRGMPFAAVCGCAAGLCLVCN